VNHDLVPDRRHCLRQKVNTPAFASFDGVTGGMILDLSEVGLAMQSPAPLEPNHRLSLHLSLGEPAAYLETTGYVAWADALGRAGVHFSDLPDESRARLREWLTLNASKPSWKAPRWVVRDSAFTHNSAFASPRVGLALSLETEPQISETGVGSNVRSGLRCDVRSTTVQYEFKSLAGDLQSALNLIASRACSITRGAAAALALNAENGMVCRAVAGINVPPLGTTVDLDVGFTAECVRTCAALRCDDTATDPRVDNEVCQQMGIRSILAAPAMYERDLVGLLEVFSTHPSTFDDGDLAVVERLAQTVVLTLSDAQVLRQD
jgi:hypothetical protein